MKDESWQLFHVHFLPLWSLSLLPISLLWTCVFCHNLSALFQQTLLQQARFTVARFFFTQKKCFKAKQQKWVYSVGVVSVGMQDVFFMLLLFFLRKITPRTSMSLKLCSYVLTYGHVLQTLNRCDCSLLMSVCLYVSDAVRCTC